MDLNLQKLLCREVKLRKDILAAEQEIIVAREEYIFTLSDRIRQLQDGEDCNLSRTTPTTTLEVAAGADIEEELEMKEQASGILLPSVSFVSSRDDVWKLSLVCEEYAEILLQPSKNQWLFKELFCILVDYLDGSSILKCREVSKCWMEVVDDYFENHASLRAYDDSTYDTRIPHPSHFLELQAIRKGIGEVSFVQPEEDSSYFILKHPNILDIKGELQGIMAHPRNPFIRRSCSIYIDDEELNVSEISPKRRGVKLSKEEFREFFKSVGKHFWYLEVNADNALELSRDARLIPLLTEDLLPYIPNIRRLRVYGYYHEMADEIGKNLFPDLSHLEVLEMENRIFTKDEQFNLEIENHSYSKYHQQLKHLTVEDSRQIDCSNFQFLEWTSLKELKISYFSMRGGTRECDWSHPLLKMNFPALRKLTLERMSSSAELRCVLHFVKRMSDRIPHLHVLHLIFQGHFSVKEEGWMEDELKNSPSHLICPARISTLEISIGDGSSFKTLNTTNFSLLLRFPFVENLHIWGLRSKRGHWKFGRESNKEEIVEVKEFARFGRMYESNIWRMMPRLKVLTVEGTRYTRKGYHLYQSDVSQKTK